ncbi:MAG TPA: glycosyl hydrolase [Solirubrobacteraceae bacterium]|nr:glycosyl hydrolase [Solirubrobacteraceae bacterium]
MHALLGRIVALLASVTVCAAALALPAATAPAAALATAHDKAGVASAVYLDSDPRKLVSLHASWAYDWSAREQPTTLGIDWVPMVWSNRYVTPQIIDDLKLAKNNGSARYLLGFNEPDNKAQANMTPQQAAALWPQLEQTGLILGSPAPTTPTDDWLPRFMKLARQRHLTVNFIALHYYLDFTNPQSVAAMRAQLIQVHNRYHRPIWITELGALDIRQWGQKMLHPPSAAAAQSYMRRVFKMLDALPFVQRYAWYTDSCASQSGCRYSSLFNTTGAVTAEGREFKRDA